MKKGSTMKKGRGHLITFEGIDGSGKSTQAELLNRFFLENGKTSHVFREPGGTVVGEKIRSILLDSSLTDMKPLSELFLYLAARVQITMQCIIPALDRGEIVLMDRFADSSVAYQGFARSLGADIVQQLNKIATCGVIPDMTFIIDCDPKNALERYSSEPDRLESEGISFMERVREGFLYLSSLDKKRYILIDGDKPVNHVQQQILTVIRKRMALT